MMKKFSCILGFMLSISACGHDSDKADPAPAPTPLVLKSPPTATQPLGLTSTTDDPNAIGVWQTDCSPCGASFCRQTADISTNSLLVSVDQFSDKACSLSQIHFRFFGTYSISNGLFISKLAQTHIKLDIPGIQSAAEYAESCGFNSWPLDTWLDVTGHECPATPEKGGVWTDLTQVGEPMIRTRYAIDGASLVFTYSNGQVIYKRVP